MKLVLIILSFLLAACSQTTENTAKVDGRLRGIAGGTAVAKSDYDKYGAILGLQMGSKSLCTASHLKGRFILTAWHCIGLAIQRNGGEQVDFVAVSMSGPVALRVTAGNYKVFYPKADKYEELGDGEGGKVQVPQPDMAVIEVIGAPEKFLNLPYADVAPVSADEVTGNFTISGWGLDSFNRATAQAGKLNTATTKIVKSDSLFHMLVWTAERAIGAGMSGDSGGPLFQFTGGRPLVYGVLSTGANLNKEGKAAGEEDPYAVVNRYVRTDTRTISDFLKEVTGL